MSIKLGVIGGGIMGEALLSRLLAQGIYAPETVIVSDPLVQRRNYLQQKYAVKVTAENKQAASTAEVLLLAIKPQILDSIAADFSDQVSDNTLVLSILAGVTLGRIESIFPQQPVVRVMPNTPATVGAAMSAIAAGSKAKPEHISQAKTIFAAVGEVVEVRESLMDAVTGVSGSGPAYVAIMIEALADGGVAVGLPRTLANQLALQTVFGTAQLLQQSTLHPAQLKDQVTSPGGTTIAGVAQLERSAFRAAVIGAVQASYQRAQELGNH